MMRNTLCLIVMLLMTGGAMAQEAGPGAAADTSPLGVRQDHVRRLVQEMEDKFVKLSKALEATEPEHARKIIDTLKAGKQALIEPRMAKVTELLNAGQLEQAEGEQRKLIAEIDKLIDLLTSTNDQRQREIEQLERLRREIEKLIAEQKDLKKQTDVTQHRDKAAAVLDEQIAALRELIAAQKRLTEQTEQAKSRGVPAVMKLADEQGKLRRQTDALGKQIDAGPAGSPEGEKDQPTPDGGKPGEQAEQAGKSQSLGAATEHQDQAEQRMGDGQGVSAGKEQDKAMEEMKKQLEKLEAKRNHIARLPEDAMEKLSDPQNKLADKTGDLDKQMQPPGSNAPAPGPGSLQPGQQGQQGQPGDSQDQQQGAPGQPQVQQAQQQMRKASGEMRKQQGDNAQGHQQKAIEALKDAQKQLEERLRQLRQETQEEKLAALEARFREMLSRQKPVTRSTGDLEVSRAAREAAEGKDARALNRPERLQLNQLTSEEGVLAEMAAKAMDIIREDGTTVVLPEVVDQLHQDLRTTVKFLSGEETGAYTQGLEREIEKTLEELIDALQKAQEQQQQQGQQGEQGEQQQQQPLVPESAELKLLKAAQVRVNRRTELFDASRPDVQRLPAELAEEVQRLAKRQEDVRQMAERLGEKR